MYYRIITRLDIKDCDIWFIRFAFDFWKKTMALGNKSGKTYIYDLSVVEPSLIKTSVLVHPKCNSAIRQTALSRDGSVLICVCDDATVWRWDVVKDSDEEIEK
jgi:polycomb protein EED